MERFGSLHLTILFLTIASPLALVALTRKYGKNAASTISLTLAFIILANKVLQLYYGLFIEKLEWFQCLPMHLCDWAFIVATLTLLFRHRLCFELTYFWVLAGTFQGLITPDINYTFPHPRFIMFFISHAGLVGIVIYMIFGLKMRPTWLSLGKALIANQVYLVAAFITNWLFGTNYGYLHAKPLNPSLLDHLGPWPWYILSMELLATTFFLISYLPFVIAPEIKKRLPCCQPDQKSIPSLDL